MNGDSVFVEQGVGGDYVQESVNVYGTGTLVEEAVRGPGRGIWHHSRCGLTAEGNHAVEWHLTYCGLYIRPGYGWRDAHAVPKRERCKRCDWSRL